VAADDTVVVKVVSGESEAQVVCGLLRSAGLECAYRDTGAREILVHRADLEAAKALLADAEG
jgi:hypothetical protein